MFSNPLLIISLLCLKWWIICNYMYNNIFDRKWERIRVYLYNVILHFPETATTTVLIYFSYYTYTTEMIKMLTNSQILDVV